MVASDLGWYLVGRFYRRKTSGGSLQAAANRNRTNHDVDDFSRSRAGAK
jgi:hypothetical protein